MTNKRVSLRAKKPSLGGYVVYQVTYNGDVVYIGEGKQGRQLHAVSGVSHVYELNKLHFTDPDGVKVEVVAEFENKEDAVRCESAMIYAKRPIFNKKHVPEKTSVSVSIPKYWSNVKKGMFDRLHTHFLCHYTVSECFGGIPVSNKLPSQNNTYLYLKSHTLEDWAKTVLFSRCVSNEIIDWFHEDGVTYIKLSKKLLDISRCDNPSKASFAKHTGMPINQI